MKTDKRQSFTDKCFKDKSGQLAIGQAPNLPIIGWFIFKILSLLPFPANWQAGLAFIATGLLFSWALWELADGVNYFRRALGAAVLIGLIVPHF